uniref:K Homology domain-containing protein n=1 Tax=Chromera velia CCMP2878 TaxID=1169474 RepID=A0A0G4FQR4_9ALVE|eukprot:Cvel_18264.t1-p1 / transcript=Cvel_18264.t1 / gene=Cvel_18264 / organism=Chromera_velia_CCMP2878 / gene_product=hypothetical protein / transcript_product=hypothetical protein / location=Cvel_scaffold1504:8458-11321(-) / protein_length=648 / sequence_SO=supercontig / SO=protein_coding / is_pseudo=false
MLPKVSVTILHSGSFSVGQQLADVCILRGVWSTPSAKSGSEGWYKMGLTGSADSILEAFSALYDKYQVIPPILLPDALQPNQESFKRQVQEGGSKFGATVNVTPLINDRGLTERILEAVGPPEAVFAFLRTFSPFIFRPSATVAAPPPESLRTASAPPVSSLPPTRTAGHVPFPPYPQHHPQNPSTHPPGVGGIAPQNANFTGVTIQPSASAFANRNDSRTITPSTSINFPHSYGNQIQEAHTGPSQLHLPLPLHLPPTTPHNIRAHQSPQPKSLPCLALQLLLETDWEALRPEGEVMAVPFEGVGWGDDPTATDGNTPTRAMYIPGLLVPRLVGGMGQCLAEFRTRSGAKIECRDRTTDERGFRRLTIRGSCAEIDRAVYLLLNKMTSWNAQDRGGPMTLTVFVPECMVHMIIGQRGAQIMGLELETGASVNIDPPRFSRAGRAREITESFGLGPQKTQEVVTALRNIQAGLAKTSNRHKEMATRLRRVLVSGTTHRVERFKALLGECVCDLLEAAVREKADSAAAKEQLPPNVIPQELIQQQQHQEAFPDPIPHVGFPTATPSPPSFYSGQPTGGPLSPPHPVSQHPSPAGYAGVLHATQGGQWTGGVGMGTGGAPSLSSAAPPPFSAPRFGGTVQGYPDEPPPYV